MIVVDVKCDGCGELLGGVTFSAEGDKKAKEAGWIVSPPQRTGQTWDDHFCPDCIRQNLLSTEQVLTAELSAVKQAYNELYRAVYDYRKTDRAPEHIKALGSRQEEIAKWLANQLDSLNRIKEAVTKTEPPR